MYIVFDMMYNFVFEMYLNSIQIIIPNIIPNIPEIPIVILVYNVPIFSE